MGDAASNNLTVCLKMGYGHFMTKIMINHGIFRILLLSPTENTAQCHTLLTTNLAMTNPPFIVDLPMKKPPFVGYFPLSCLMTGEYDQWCPDIGIVLSWVRTATLFVPWISLYRPIKQRRVLWLPRWWRLLHQQKAWKPQRNNKISGSECVRVPLKKKHIPPMVLTYPENSVPRTSGATNPGVSLYTFLTSFKATNRWDTPHF